MSSANPFPDSDEKKYLRRLHLAYLSQRKEELDRDLAYFGLPSAEMTDVELWKPVLGRITAVERLPDVAQDMYRTAQKVGVRSRLVLLETGLLEASRLLAMPERQLGLEVARIPPAEQEKLAQVRKTAYDVVNLDLCGGFLYPNQTGESRNVEILKNLIEFQTKHGAGFLLLVTFNLREQGRDHYDMFISDALQRLKDSGVAVPELAAFLRADNSNRDHFPPLLRRLWFCVPAFLQKIAFDSFQLTSRGTWYYKTFYHAGLTFEPKRGRSALGLSWPPIDELKELLMKPVMRVQSDGSGGVTTKTLATPKLW